MNIMDKLLSGDDLRARLESISSDISEFTLVTAYIKYNAVEWLASLLKKDVKINLVARLSPQDIVNGSSDIGAIEFALNEGWTCYRFPELHAKLYLINNKTLFVGSSNFTSRGLLLYGAGNLEATIEIDAMQSHIDFINKIISKSICLSPDNIIKMKEIIEKSTLIQETSFYWDEDFDSLIEIWSSDFPWLSAECLLNTDNIHDRDLFGVNSSDDEMAIRIKFKKSKSFLWLQSQLAQADNTIVFFGRISSILHNTLQDDPSLYRKDVKSLLTNLLSYCNYYANDIVIIDRPNHSQRIRLVDKLSK